MKILVLTPHYPPDVAATGQLLEELVDDAVAAGHEVVVVTARPTFLAGGAPEGSASGRVFRRGSDLRFLRVPKWGRRGTWGRLVPFAAYFVASARCLRSIRGVDLVFAMSTPPLLGGILAASRQSRCGIPFVYNLQDVYPDVAEALGVVGRGPLRAVTRRVERGLRERADAVVVVGRDMAEIVGGQSPGIARLETIPNWIDTRAVVPVPAGENPLREELGLGGRFVVLYSGSLGRAHGAELLPEVAERLAELEDVVLLVVGDGPAKSEVVAGVASRGLRNVRFLPFRPKAALSSSLSVADVSLVLQRAETRGLVVPSKVYGILASGRPVIAAVPEGSEVARVVDEAGAGSVVRSGDVGGIASAVRRFRSSPGEAAAAGDRGRRRVVAEYDRRVATGRYLSLFEELVAARRSRT